MNNLSGLGVVALCGAVCAFVVTLQMGYPNEGFSVRKKILSWFR